MYKGLVELLTTHIHGINAEHAGQYLRNADFSEFDEPQRIVLSAIIPELDASLMPDDTDNEGSPAHSFDQALGALHTSSGALRLLNEETVPVTEEHLRSLTAALRTTALFSAHVYGTDCRSALIAKMPFIIAKFIVDAGNAHRMPRAIMKKLTADEIGLLRISAGLHANGQSYREKERDDSIERIVREITVPEAVFSASPQKTMQIRGAVRDSIWKAWKTRETAISDYQRQRHLAVKIFLRAYPNPAVLVPWLLGENN